MTEQELLQTDNLDSAYLSHWAKLLKVEESFEKIRRGELRPKSS